MQKQEHTSDQLESVPSHAPYGLLSKYGREKTFNLPHSAIKVLKDFNLFDKCWTWLFTLSLSLTSRNALSTSSVVYSKHFVDPITGKTLEKKINNCNKKNVEIQ